MSSGVGVMCACVCQRGGLVNGKTGCLSYPVRYTRLVCACVDVCVCEHVRWRQAASHVGEKYSILRAGGAVLGPVL